MNVVRTFTEGFGCGFDLEEGDLFVEVDSCGRMNRYPSNYIVLLISV
jgi:hypothetical protein